MENKFQKVSGLEVRIDSSLNELSNLIEDYFGASALPLDKLPADYSAISGTLDKAHGLLNRVITALKVQSVLADSALLEATEQTPLEASKRKTLQAILEA